MCGLYVYEYYLVFEKFDSLIDMYHRYAKTLCRKDSISIAEIQSLIEIIYWWRIC